MNVYLLDVEDVLIAPYTKDLRKDYLLDVEDVLIASYTKDLIKFSFCIFKIQQSL